MTQAQVYSVNLSQPRRHGWQRRPTSIRREPVAGAVEVGTLGVVGDRVGNPKHHGGPDKALYAFALEDLRLWSERLGIELSPGDFGENLTTVGIDVNEALVGEQWRIGDVLLEIRCMRTPCATFQGWLASRGTPATGWVRRFNAEERPGPYLRVLAPGELRAGDAIEVVHRPDHTVTVSEMFRALVTQRERLPILAAVPDLFDEAQAKLDRHLSSSY